MVEIDDIGRLLVTPATKEFLYVYREAMEVHWDISRKALFSPIPREWTRRQWFEQIVLAAREQGVELYLTEKTVWRNVDEDSRTEIAAFALNLPRD